VVSRSRCTANYLCNGGNVACACAKVASHRRDIRPGALAELELLAEDGADHAKPDSGTYGFGRDRIELQPRILASQLAREVKSAFR
jgi:hypothetical protein